MIRIAMKIRDIEPIQNVVFKFNNIVNVKCFKFIEPIQNVVFK